MDSRVDESKLRHPVEFPLYLAFVVLNFTLMAAALLIATRSADWLSAYPILAKNADRLRALAVAAVLGVPAIAFLRNTRRAQTVGNSIRVSPQQLPEIHDIFRRHCEKLGLAEDPELYVSEVSVRGPAQAYTAWKRQYIVLGTTFLQPNLKPMRETISFLLGRELGRLRLGHASALKEFLLSYVLKIPYIRNPLLRVFTYSEDRYGAFLTPESLLGLIAIASGRRMAGEVNVADYLRQAKEYRSVWGRLSGLISDTPQISYRVQALFEAGLAPTLYPELRRSG